MNNFHDENKAIHVYGSFFILQVVMQFAFVWSIYL